MNFKKSAAKWDNRHTNFAFSNQITRTNGRSENLRLSIFYIIFHLTNSIYLDIFFRSQSGKHKRNQNNSCNKIKRGISHINFKTTITT